MSILEIILAASLPIGSAAVLVFRYRFNRRRAPDKSVRKTRRKSVQPPLS